MEEIMRSDEDCLFELLEDVALVDICLFFDEVIVENLDKVSHPISFLTF